jgi:AbrB family transcriptional regulator (stage V sporulation protein T)
MKATGIVRRIDDLGRVVIPKEIRRTMRIREGDPLEIFTDHEGEVIFKKYSPIGELTGIAVQYADALNKTCGLSIVVIDRDVVVACAGAPKKDILENRISTDIENIIDGRQLYVWHEGGEKILVSEKQEKHFVQAAMPIFAEGDVIGAVAVIGGETMTEAGETEIKLIQTASAFLGKQLEA